VFSLLAPLRSFVGADLFKSLPICTISTLMQSQGTEWPDARRRHFLWRDVNAKQGCGRIETYLRVANVQDGYLDLNEVKPVRVLHSEIDRLALMDGDVLMNEGGLASGSSAKLSKG